MKTTLVLLACLATTSLAQSPIPQPEIRRIRSVNSPAQITSADIPAFPDNYLVTLSVTEGDKTITELVIATSRPEFKADSIDPALVFAGTLTLSEDGTILITYNLGAEIAVEMKALQNDVGPMIQPGTVPARPPTIQYKSQTAQAQVRLKLGEPLNILRTGPRTYRLTVAKLAIPQTGGH